MILLVFDEFPTDSIAGPDGRIDSTRFPGFGALAGTSTWFPNHHAVSDSTMASVPSILTSTPPQRDKEQYKITYKRYRHSLFTLLGSRGYRISATDVDTRICPPRYCSYREPFRVRFPTVRTRVQEIDGFVRSLRRTERPRLTYLHTLLPHVPWHLSPSGNHRDAGPRRQVARKLAGHWGFHDPFLTTQNEQRHLLQVGFVDAVVQSLISRLKQQGLFDRSLIVITADHGISFELGGIDRRLLRRDARNVHEIAPVPLFVKRPGQRRGRVSAAWVRGTDVVPTIADVLDLRLPWRPAGASAYSPSVAARRHLVTSSPHSGRTVRIRGSVIERRRRANLARRQRLFGTGAWDSVFRIGPNLHLLGMRPEDLPSTPAAAGLVAEFDLPPDLRSVDLSARFLPTWAVGYLRGGDTGTAVRRDLALAVNGRIRAVGRSAHLDRNTKELFSLIFDERHLVSGRNTVQLYEVRRSGPNVALAPLGGR